MAQVASVDYDAKRIHLHADTVVIGFDVILAYFEINALRAANVNGEQNRAHCLSAEGKIPKGGGKFTPRYGILEPGWRIVPYNGVSHVLAINVEVLSPDLGGLSGRDVFDRTPLPPSIEVQIDHNWDQVEVIEVNTGSAVNKATVIEALIDQGYTSGRATEIDSISAIKSKTDSLNFTVPGQIDSNLKSIADIANSTQLTECITTTGSLTPTDVDNISNAVWDKLLEDMRQAGSAGERLKILLTFDDFIALK